MKLRLIPVSLLIISLTTSCSTDPTTSDEFQALEQELAASDQQLAEANQELAQAEAQVAAATAELDAAPVKAPAEQEVTLPAEAVAVLDGVKAAQAAYDTNEMRQYLTDGFTFQSYGDVTEVDAYMEYIDAHYEGMGFELEAIGPIVATGGNDTYIVAEPGIATWTGNPGLHGFSISTLTHENGTWLSSQVRWIGEDLP